MSQHVHYIKTYPNVVGDWSGSVLVRGGFLIQDYHQNISYIHSSVSIDLLGITTAAVLENESWMATSGMHGDRRHPSPAFSHNDLTDMDSESSYVANANRKFRTITTMLHVFQSINKDEVPSIRDPPEAEEQGRRRKLLSALATLFVRATEVVAVASVGIKAHETAIVAVERVARAAVVEGADTSTNTDDTQTLETGAALPLQYIAVSNAVRATASPNASPEEANTNNAEPHSWCEHIHVLRGATTSSEVEIIRSLAQSKGKPPG